MTIDLESDVTPSHMPFTLRPIPATTAGPLTEDQRAVLLWVHTGSATVEAGGESHRIAAGEALWVPPGVEHCTRTDEGSVVLPIFPVFPKPRDALAEVRIITVPPGWENWLVSQFDLNRHHTQGWHSDVRALLGRARTDPPGGAGEVNASAMPLPPMPYSREAREVAQTVMRSPGSPRGLAHLAPEQSVSARTLQRQFQAETGMAFSEWRTRARVAAAASHLADGRAIGWTGRHVGFASPSGFTRAFRKHAGVTPQDYVPAHRQTRDRDRPAPHAEQSGRLAALVAEEAQKPPPIPPRQEWSWVDHLHVLWWVHHGHIRILVGGREFTLHSGQAIWLPAGLSTSVQDLAQGSIVLPLGGYRGNINLSTEELRVFTFPNEAEAFLLHTVLTEYFLFRTDVEQPRLANELFRELFVLDRYSTSDGLTGAVATIARSLYRNPANARSLGEWASQLRLDPTRLGQEFLRQTGTSFPRWRAQLRMTHARTLLLFGDPPREVARVLGYATSAYFRTVFTRAHGMTPRAYQQLVSDRTAT